MTQGEALRSEWDQQNQMNLNKHRVLLDADTDDEPERTQKFTLSSNMDGVTQPTLDALNRQIERGTR